MTFSHLSDWSESPVGLLWSVSTKCIWLNNNNWEASPRYISISPTRWRHIHWQKNFDTEHGFFHQIFPMPNPISWKNWKVLNLIPNIFNTKSNTFYTKFVWYWFQYFLDTKFFDTDSDTIQRIEKFQNQEVLQPKHHTLYRTVWQYLWHQNSNQMQVQMQMQVQVVPFGNWTFPQLQLQ